MKRSVVIVLLLALMGIPRYAQAELSAPTGVKATEGTYSNVISISWNPVASATFYEIWRDDYSGCIEQLPCEPEFNFWMQAFETQRWDYLNQIYLNEFFYDVVIEYRIKACFTDEITKENICSDFSLPAYGYTSEDGKFWVDPIASAIGGGGGIFGDIIKSSVIGYHLDGWTAEGIEIYMPVTQGFKALKGAQEYVRSFAPGLAEFVRECFDYLEQKADSNKGGFLYNFGTHVFPILGKIAEKGLELIGKQKFIDAAYSDTTISVEAFKNLERRGQAIAPKVLKDREISQQEKIFTYPY